MDEMNLIVGEKHSIMQIKGCSTAICGECCYTIGVPKKYLTNEAQWFDITCPVCENEFQLYASLRSCYE